MISFNKHCTKKLHRIPKRTHSDNNPPNRKKEGFKTTSMHMIHTSPSSTKLLSKKGRLAPRRLRG